MEDSVDSLARAHYCKDGWLDAGWTGWESAFGSWPPGEPLRSVFPFVCRVRVGMLEFSVGLAIAAVLGFTSLAIGTKIARMSLSLLELVLISVISGLFTMIPKVGFPFGAVIMLVMLSKWSDAEFWPDTFANVAVAQLLAFFGMFFLTPLVVGLLA